MKLHTNEVQPPPNPNKFFAEIPAAPGQLCPRPIELEQAEEALAAIDAETDETFEAAVAAAGDADDLDAMIRLQYLDGQRDVRRRAAESRVLRLRVDYYRGVADTYRPAVGRVGTPDA